MVFIRWFFGNISRQDAEAILIQCKYDAFLVRERESSPISYVISHRRWQEPNPSHTLIILR